MPNVGDKITVTISSPAATGTNLGGVLTIVPGESMEILGTIVEDRGNQWLVELSLSIGKKNRILVPKTAQRQ